MGECVPELVLVNALDACLGGAPLDHLADSLRAQCAGTALPVVRTGNVGTAGAGALASAEGICGPASERAGADGATLASDEHHLLNVIHIGQAKPD